MRRNCNSSHLCKPILSIKTSWFALKSHFFTCLVHIHSWCETSEGSMVVVPPTPIIFCISPFFEWEIVEYSTDMWSPCFDNPLQVIVLVVLSHTFGIRIDLLGQKSSYFYNSLGESLYVLFKFRNLRYPNVSNIHFEFFGSVILEVFFGNRLGFIRAAVNIVASLWCVILSPKLLDTTGPSQAVINFRSFIFFESILGQMG